MSDAQPTSITSQQVDPDRLAGHEYEVRLCYTVEYRLNLIAGPDDTHAIEEAKKVATPAGPVDPSEWELVHKEVDVIDDIWMDDVRAPDAVEWLDEPHRPSEDTFWDDSRHFEQVDDA